MEDYIWRKLKTVKVPDPQTVAWTPALDFLIPNRLYRFQVEHTSRWKSDGAAGECSADGYDNNGPQRNGDPLCITSPFGALIAKIGGSSADKSGTIFGVGRHCVCQISDIAKLGPVYFGINDVAAAMTKVKGQLEVAIEIAL
jgi:hypothetical protein